LSFPVFKLPVNIGTSAFVAPPLSHRDAANELANVKINRALLSIWKRPAFDSGHSTVVTRLIS